MQFPNTIVEDFPQILVCRQRISARMPLFFPHFLCGEILDSTFFVWRAGNPSYVEFHIFCVEKKGLDAFSVSTPFPMFHEMVVDFIFCMIFFDFGTFFFHIFCVEFFHTKNVESRNRKNVESGNRKKKVWMPGFGMSGFGGFGRILDY